MLYSSKSFHIIPETNISTYARKIGFPGREKRGGGWLAGRFIFEEIPGGDRRPREGGVDGKERNE